MKKKVRTSDMAMAYIIVIIVAVAMAIFFIEGVETKKESLWIEFESEEGRFSALFPHEPELKTKIIKTIFGNVTLYDYSARDENGTIYGILYADFPQESFENRTVEQIEQMLDETVTGMVLGLNGTLLYKESIYLDGNPGREIEIASGNNLIRERFYLVGKRNYQMLVTTGKDKTFHKKIDDFFNSLKLLS